MYITLFIIVLIVGLLMVLLPSKAIKNLVNQNGVLVVLRLLGIIMCVASSVTIYALVAGKIALPLSIRLFETAAQFSEPPFLFGYSVTPRRPIGGCRRVHLTFSQFP